jgi:hypothetical protein
MVPRVGSIIAVGGTIYIWWNIFERMKKPQWYAFLMAIPIVNLVMIGLLAWGD